MDTPAGYANCSLRLTLAGMSRPAFITFGVDPGGTEPTTIATSILTAWLNTGSMNSRLDSNVTMSEITVRVGQDGGDDLIGSVTNSTSGTRSAQSPPPNVAVLVYKRTARGGRRGRGRWFLPWMLLQTEIGEDGTLTPVAISSTSTAAEVFRTTLSAGGNPMVVLHSPGTSAQGAPDVVTSLVCSNLISTQRRRLGR